jgi:uncharacterized membrane protein YuzA (DUF378 family)
MKGPVCLVAALLASIGAINWGLVAFLKFNLVEYLDMLSGNKGLDLVIYGLVALSGLYTLVMLIVSLFKGCSCQ